MLQGFGMNKAYICTFRTSSIHTDRHGQECLSFLSAVLTWHNHTGEPFSVSDTKYVLEGAKANTPY